MPENIDIIINGIDNATKEIKKVASSINTLDTDVKESHMDFTELNSAMSIAGNVLNTLEKAYDAVIIPTIEYSKQVESLSTLTGDTTENTSLLIQAAKDLDIPVKTLTTAMENAIKKGYDPSISGLEEIRIKYQNLQDPIAQSKLLMDTFGQSGADMAPLMKLSADELENLNQKAREAGLVMSGDNLQAIKDYSKSMNELESRLDGVKIKLGTELIPKFLWLIDNSTNVQDNIDKQGLAWTRYLGPLGAIVQSLKWIIQLSGGARDNLGGMWNNYGGGIGGYNQDLRSGLGHASGANFVVPPGFPNDSFPMRVQSGEHVQVTPAGKSSGTNGNGVTLVYSPLISLASEAEAERVLLPMLRKLQRAM
jgi:hypothetical protein